MASRFALLVALNCSCIAFAIHHVEEKGDHVQSRMVRMEVPPNADVGAFADMSPDAHAPWMMAELEVTLPEVAEPASSALAAGMASFHLLGEKIQKTWEQLWGESDMSGLLYPAAEACRSTEGSEWHKATPNFMLASSADAAKFVTACMTRPDQMKDLLALPNRSVEKPYLVWTAGFHINEVSYDNCSAVKFMDDCLMLAKLVRRGDFLFTNFDGREYATQVANARPLPGPTMAPPHGLGMGFEGGEAWPKKTRYLMSFQGTIKVGTRTELRKAFDDKKMKKRSDVFVVVLKEGEKRPEGLPYDEMLKQSAFTLVPRGDGRWNYRFSEALRFCSIPVVLADGLTLPFAEIVDWREAALVLPESLASKPEELIKSLPRDEATIDKMRRKACEIHQQYFESAEKRAMALLSSAKVIADSTK